MTAPTAAPAGPAIAPPAAPAAAPAAAAPTPVPTGWAPFSPESGSRFSEPPEPESVCFVLAIVNLPDVCFTGEDPRCVQRRWLSMQSGCRFPVTAAAGLRG